jgi:hypothetical protein
VLLIFDGVTRLECNIQSWASLSLQKRQEILLLCCSLCMSQSRDVKAVYFLQEPM